MPPVRRQRAGATNTRSGGQARLVRRVIPVHTPAPVPVVVEAVDVAKVVPMEEEANQNVGALQALRLQNRLDEVPASLFLVKSNRLKLKKCIHLRLRVKK